MKPYERLSRGSDRHSANATAESIQLFPANNSHSALERFQSVANDALKYNGVGYVIVNEHSVGDFYDTLVLRKLGV